MPRHTLIVAAATMTQTVPFSAGFRRRHPLDGEVLIVVPIQPNWLQSLCSDIDEAREIAADRLAYVARRLAGVAPTARTQMGDEDPLQAVADALADFPADNCVVVRDPSRGPGPGHHDLLREIGSRFALDCTEIRVDSAGHLIAGRRVDDNLVATAGAGASSGH